MSRLRSLRQRVEAARAANTIDLRVIELDGLFVRCRALSSDELQEVVDRNEKSKTAGVDSAIDAIVTTCVGVWEESDGKGVSPLDGFEGVVDLDSGVLSGILPTFVSPELARELDVAEGSTAAAAVRALLAPVSELRLTRYGDAIIDFSTGSGTEVLRGN